MSHCFPIESLGEPNIYQNLGDFTRMWDFTWRVSDCEELVEAITEVVRVGLTEWQVYWWRWRDSNQPHQIVCNYIIIKFNFLK